MMSSAIPARLEFQCGHAALVSLPRVKGESPAQRADRIGRAKTAAQVRSCDFCPPALELVPYALTPVAAATVPVLDPQAAPAPAPVALPVAPVAVPTAPVALPVAPVVKTTDAPARTPRKRIGRSRRTAAPVAQSRPTGPAVNHRFVVRFRTEARVHATDVRDALRQAEALGANEVLALIRTA